MKGHGLGSYFNTDILRWVMVMFAFRMVMVARVGDQVYSDEQEYFYCNTNTPGCNQVCPPILQEKCLQCYSGVF